MDDKIESWRHGLLRLVLQHARAYADNSDPAKTEAAYVAICDYLRTTPEGYRLADERENEALRKDAERYRWLRSRDLDTIDKGGVFAGMTPRNIVLNEEHLDTAIDAALKEQSKC